MPNVDLIVLNYNDANGCVSFVRRHEKIDLISHIIIVDNNSSDNSVDELSRLINNRVVLVKASSNTGYASGNNLGISYAMRNFESDYIIVSNPDVLFDEDCLNRCIETLDNNGSLIVCAPRMKDVLGNAQPCAWNIATWFRYGWETLPFTKKNRTVSERDYSEKDYVICDCVAGSLFVVAAKRVSRHDFFDPGTFLYCEETILGFLNGKSKAASLSNYYFIHAHSQSISKTYKKNLQRQRLLWKSKYYVFKNYYRLGFLKMMVIRLIKTINLALCFILSFVKKK